MKFGKVCYCHRHFASLRSCSVSSGLSRASVA
uniref:Uncharacterized protein n=1 Tax=Arundo donax TaxID=35708 RepID=A0A0A8YGC6_ARUDO